MKTIKCKHKYTELTVQTDWCREKFDYVEFDGLRYKYEEDVPHTFGVQTCVLCNFKRELTMDELLDIANGEVSAWE